MDHLDSKQIETRVREQGKRFLEKVLIGTPGLQLRKTILFATIRCWKENTTDKPKSASQQRLSTNTGREVKEDAVQVLLASVVDEDLGRDVILKLCKRAADAYMETVLVKGLVVLSGMGNDNTGDMGKENAHDNGEEEEEEEMDLFSEGEKIRARGKGGVEDFVKGLIKNVVEKGGKNIGKGLAMVVAVVREVWVGDGLIRLILHQVLREMEKVDVGELPAFIYQVLLLAGKRGGGKEKSNVLLGITEMFGRLEKRARRLEEQSQSMMDEDEDAIVSVGYVSVRELRQIQGTALLHVEYVVKQDPGLGVEIGRLVKAGVECSNRFLTPFGIGVVLAVAKSVGRQYEVLEGLREAMGRYGREMERRKQNLFVGRVTLNDEEVVDPRLSVLFVAECMCEYGWEYVKESLLAFALLVMDRPLGRGGDGEECLGRRLLVKLFEGDAGIRERIMEEMTSRIALQEKSTNKAIAVVRQLAEKIPFYVMEHSRYVKDGIEFLVTLPPWISMELMIAYKPLLMARQDLRNYFHLVIRKCLFKRDAASRAVAISGFLMIASLGGSFQSGNTSQSQLQPNSSQYQTNGFEVVFESLQPIRKIFSYPAAQRAFLYNSVTQCLQQGSEDVACNVGTALSEILRRHLQTFVDPARPPHVHLERCVNENENGELVEPLGELTWCVALCESLRDAAEYPRSYIIDLARRVANVSIQDFHVARDLLTAGSQPLATPSEIEDGQRVSRASRNKIRVVAALCEGLINSTLLLKPSDLTWSIVSEILIPLLALKRAAFDLLREAGAASPADAFGELGGDMGIERLRPGFKMFLQRGIKSSNSTKAKKRKHGNRGRPTENNGATASNQVTSDHRFGCFSILASASSRPQLPLDVTMRVLSSMSDAMASASGDMRNAFRGQIDSRDFQELRTYLLAVAQKHVEDFITNTTKEDGHLTLSSLTVMTGAINGLTRMAMGDFKRFRRCLSSSKGQNGLMALQIAEKCAYCLTLLGKLDIETVSSFCHALLLKPEASPVQWNQPDVFDSAVDAIEKLADSLMQDELIKEASVVLRMYESMVKIVSRSLRGVEKISVFLDKRIEWAADLLSEKSIQDVGVVKVLAQYCLLYTKNNNDLRRAGHLCQRLLEVIGDCDENAQISQGIENAEEKLVSAQSIRQETCLSVVNVVLDVLDQAVNDVEWCLCRMSALESSLDNNGMEVDGEPYKNSQGYENDAAQQQMIAKQAMRAEDAAQLRLEGVVRTLRGLARCAIAKWNQKEKLLKLITKTYKVLCTAAQAQTKRRGDPRTSFTSLVDACKGLSPTLWTYLAFAGAENAMDRSSKRSSSASREARVMPQLIYEVERFEKVLIAVQKKTKINLLRGMRRNIARDFRIREELLQDDDHDDSNEGGDSNDTAMRNGPSSSSKRLRSR